MAMQAAARPVHPHMRGVYEGFKLDDTPHYGSSPRAWGLLLCPLPSRSWCRSIPTYVGFTVVSARTFRSFPGPSPHTWGLRWWWSRPPGHPPVHPHIRGVYDYGAPTTRKRFGPSPHTWGLLYIPACNMYKCRSIPTYVGFTIESSELEQGSNGPSPHTWGLLLDWVMGDGIFRSIPTYVGFTPRGMTMGSKITVHPHIRGVYAPYRRLAYSKIGPSPHTWGLRGWP